MREDSPERPIPAARAVGYITVTPTPPLDATPSHPDAEPVLALMRASRIPDPELACQALISPVTDHRFDTESSVDSG
ncbi:hypothetical protein GCM10011581_27560 [Saccharopolyspora subtropica]|uniref:Uncharacterized protein n=1 Tax=Saccharopolyspora thermophila TaxID=89367 RepID=A0A917NE47_9PSEU|nr:hypothetical protein [Saccharopolyspora subtropica]GGI88965.1 hypothetical protein GCM10011581_27560 [Saccharopolyspora subtropica]